MSAKRKGISQREAVRNRRELRKLRAFVRAIEGTYPTGESTEHIVSLDVSSVYTAKARGIAWGAQNRVAFLVRVDTGAISIVAIRTPEAK